MLDVITLLAANIHDDLNQCVGNVNDTANVNMTLANNVLSAVVIPGNIKLDTLGNCTNNTNLNVNTTTHGLCPRLSGNALEYLSGTGGWSVPAGGNANGANHPPASVNDTATINFSIDSANQIISGNVVPGNIKLDNLGTPDDNTDLNASTSRHGLLRKLSGNTNEYLAGDGTWAVPGGGANSNHSPVTVNDTTTVNLTITANQLLSAVVIPSGIALDDLGIPSNSTDLDANTSRHGLLRRLSGNANQFLNGAGNWTVPPTGNAANCEAGSSVGLMGFELTSYSGTWLESADANQRMAYMTWNLSANNLDYRMTTIYLAKGTYRLEFLGARSASAGILQFLLDTTSLGTVDLYSSNAPGSVDYNFRHTINGINIANANTYDLKLRSNSKNANSSAYMIYITRVSIRRIA